jgi:hypothetical protein
MEQCLDCHKSFPRQVFLKTHIPCPGLRGASTPPRKRLTPAFRRAVADIADAAHDGMAVDGDGTDAAATAAQPAPAQPAGPELDGSWRVEYSRVEPLAPFAGSDNPVVFNIAAKFTEYINMYKLTRAAIISLWALLVVVCSYAAVRRTLLVFIKSFLCVFFIIFFLPFLSTRQSN